MLEKSIAWEIFNIQIKTIFQLKEGKCEVRYSTRWCGDNNKMSFKVKLIYYLLYKNNYIKKKSKKNAKTYFITSSGLAKKKFFIWKVM